MLTAKAPTRTSSAAGSALAWTAVLLCAVYSLFALTMATTTVLRWLDPGDQGSDRAAPPLFVLHATSGAVALLAGSLQLRLATRVLGSRRSIHRRLGRTYLWAAWTTSLSSLGVAAFFDVSLAAKTAFAGVSLLWFATTTVAFLRIRHGKVRQHREWMIRSFSLALFFVTGSLWPPILAATPLPQAIGYPLALFLSWSLNLLAAEWWIRRTRASQHRNLPAGLDPSTRRSSRLQVHSSKADAPARQLPATSEAGRRGLLLALGAAQLGLGSWMALAPASFYARVAPFGVRNEHLLRDLSTVSLTLGVAALLAAARPTWRVPVLAITLLQFTLHTLNHLLDIGQADPGWLGPANALVLALATAALALTLHALRQPAAPPGQPPQQDRRSTTMRSVVIGASGVIGRELLRLPAELDHQVMAQARSTAKGCDLDPVRRRYTPCMAGCCPSRDYHRFFNQRFARRLANRYRKRGLDTTARKMVQFLQGLGVEGASVLEVGGGVGEVEVELLKAGAAHAQNLELSPAYEQQARTLATQAGVQGRLDWRIHDLAEDPGAVEPADLVVMHRVVCCYPDYERLLAAAADHARRALVFSYPPRNLLSRGFYGVFNLVMRLTRSSFRGFAHPPGAMLAVLEDHGLRQTYQRRSRIWQVAGLERVS